MTRRFIAFTSSAVRCRALESVPLPRLVLLNRWRIDSAYWKNSRAKISLREHEKQTA